MILKFREIEIPRKTDEPTKQTFEYLVKSLDLANLVLIAANEDYAYCSGQVISKDLNTARELVTWLRNNKLDIAGKVAIETANIWRLTVIILDELLDSIYKYVYTKHIIVSPRDVNTIKRAEYVVGRVAAMLRYEFDLDNMTSEVTQYSFDNKLCKPDDSYDKMLDAYISSLYEYYADIETNDEVIKQVVRDCGFDSLTDLVALIGEICMVSPPFLNASYVNPGIWNALINVLENHVFTPIKDEVTGELKRDQTLEDFVNSKNVYEIDVKYIMTEVLKDLGDYNREELEDAIDAIKKRDAKPLPLLEYSAFAGRFLDLAETAGHSDILVKHGYRITSEFIDEVIVNCNGYMTEEYWDKLQGMPETSIKESIGVEGYYNPTKQFS